jgi:PilZ domain
MIAALQPQQVLRLRFELSLPRLRVETRGEVTWATPSGQCGIRFLDLSPKTARQINEWIFASLLEETSLHSEWEGSSLAKSQFGRSMFEASAMRAPAASTDGLMVSAAAVPVIEMAMRADPLPALRARAAAFEPIAPAPSEFDWLFRPLSSRALVWIVNALVLVAALLLFALVFLSVTGESPRWPLAVAAASAMFVLALYWGFFRLFGGSSPGVRLARLAGCDLQKDKTDGARFR